MHTTSVDQIAQTANAKEMHMSKKTSHKDYIDQKEDFSYESENLV